MIKRLLKKYAVNSSRIHLRRINAEFAATVPAGALVLDAASGGQPYADLFAHACYESADFEQVEKAYGPTTYVCDLRSIPVADGRFDVIIFNQGLEHMPEPVAVLSELARVLKPGGKMLCTAPLFYEEHEQPHDYYRYTRFAYEYMFPKAGFVVERIDWLEGYLGTVAYQLDTAARYLPRGVLMLVPRILFAFFAILFYRIDSRKPYRRKGYPKNYVVVARKSAA